VTVRLADHTTLRIGGPVGDFVHATTEAQLIEQVTALDGAGHPLLLLGGGSNLVCGDKGFDGTVIAMGVRGLTIRVANDVVDIVACCGESWDGLVAHAVDSGWAGIEALSGIPGLVGATPIQNVGAYGQDVSQTITRVRALDRTTGLVVELTAADCEFTYRGESTGFYDLRCIDGMVQHHTGALRMSEFVFNIGQPGVGALGKTIWRDQANEIRAMGLWRKAWYTPGARLPGGPGERRRSEQPQRPHPHEPSPDRWHADDGRAPHQGEQGGVVPRGHA
jgi:hypothetical protein